LFVNKELILGTVVLSVIFLAIAAVPILGFIVGIFTPLAVLYFSQSSRIQGLFILIFSLIPTFLVLRSLDMQGNLPFLFSWGAVGFFLSEFIKRKNPIDKAVFYSVLLLLAMGLSFLMIYSFQIGEDPWSVVETAIKQGVQEGIQAYSQAGVAPDQLKAIRNQIPEITKTIYHLFPAIAVISSIFFVWINVMAARVVLAWKKTAVLAADDLALWKIPDKLVWFVIASGALILLPVESFRIAGLNLIAIFLFIYFFQGLSIVYFFFQKKQAPLFLRGIIYTLIFIQQILLLMVVALGFFDLWVDFRKINREIKLSEEKGETQ